MKTLKCTLSGRIKVNFKGRGIIKKAECISQLSSNPWRKQMVRTDIH